MKSFPIGLALKWRGRSGGAALVVTLALIVLITALLMAFFVNSTLNGQLETSSTSRVETDILVRSALELVVGDLKREMMAGSLDVGQTGGVLRPTTNATILPYRVLADSSMAASTAFDTLIKQSIPGSSSFPNAAPYGNNGAVSRIPPASVVSTLSSAPNNRKISLDRWNEPGLLSSNGFTNNAQAPNWIYIGSEGVTNVSPTNVVGRFAFNVYNVGGLLNINIAGTPAILSEAQRLALKGTPAGAILQGNIPGIVDANALIAWRNAKTAPSALSYTNTILSDTNGFRQSADGDNRFVSRQDLIHYIRSNPDILTTNALPYITTFSLERNTPSWGPETNAPAAAYAYLDQSTNAASTNRLAYTVRRPLSRQITSYDHNGNLASYDAKVGDPLFRKRFPLDRLKWIKATGPMEGISPAAISSQFGLTWNSAAKAWDYTATNSVGGIATLNEVASGLSGREPNFFETLKAAILSGSLGKEAGDGVSANGTFDRKTDYQIIQIGCNMIDQYRADDLPTRVRFDSSEYGTLAGATDLPYFNKILHMFYRPPVGEATTLGNQDLERRLVGAWLVPELWRPHRRSAYGPPADNQDIQVIVKKGKLTLSLYSGNSAQHLSANISGATMGLNVAASAFRGTPDIVRSAPIITPAYGTITDTAPSGFGTLWGFNVTYSDAFRDQVSPPEIRGFMLADKPATMRRALLRPEAGAPMDISMQVSGPNGYLEYDLIKNYQRAIGGVPWPGLQGNHASSPGGGLSDPAFTNIYVCPPGWGTAIYGGGSNPSSGNSLTWALPVAAVGRSDPRTDRFGLSFFMAPQLGWLKAELKTTGVGLYSDPSTLPRLCPYAAPDTFGYWPQYGGLRAVKETPAGQFTSTGWYNFQGDLGGEFRGYYPGALTDNTKNNVKGSVYYTDNDGVQRRALGAYQTYLMNETERAPLMLNRPFFSVGDLGYVHRGEPWKNIDFFTKESADAGLLDFFTISDFGELTGGKVDLNSAPPEVLAAYLEGTVKDEGAASSTISSSEALAEAKLIRDEVKVAPFSNKAELVTRFSDTSPLRSSLSKDKGLHESYIRGLADVTQTRTWNLMIDVIAQKGRIPPGKDFPGFIVEGERRYWLHVAIDRFTGEILDQRLEAVYE